MYDTSPTYSTSILITCPDINKLYIPLYNNINGITDDGTSMYRVDVSPTSTVIIFTFNAEDFQMLTNFPFKIEVYN
jgi:hypothetical protein